ncbi:hypothetical protein V8Z80_08220 [Orrella sp. JC864]|uniref:hypothetical protein n=1 Tax=Orrella sp. JC864 TaxID=3120298 RepID=UPI00300A7E05
MPDDIKSALPPLPFGFHSPDDDWLSQIAGGSNRAHCVADIEAYGRACYTQARADLIAEMHKRLIDRAVAGTMLVADVRAILPEK